MSLFSKKKPQEPQSVEEILGEFKLLQSDFAKLSENFRALQNKNIDNLQKIAVVRFNPFNETGGNQSFSLAILDGNDYGIVITSLFSRNENRVYSKPIKNGISEFTLTDEEKQAIVAAQKRNDKEIANSKAKN
jgi:hypothetical protein